MYVIDDCVNKKCLINIVCTYTYICGLFTRTENGRCNSKGNVKKVKLVSITGSFIY